MSLNKTNARSPQARVAPYSYYRFDLVEGWFRVADDLLDLRPSFSSFLNVFA